MPATARRPAKKSTMYSPEICADAPDTGRSSMPRLEACAEAADDRFTRSGTARLQALRSLDDKADLFVGTDGSFFAAPASEQSLAQLYARHPDATIVAGATDVGLWITKKLAPIEKVIHVGRVAGLSSIEETARAMRSARPFHWRAPRRVGIDRSRYRRSVAAVRLDPGARLRHGRRQYRQRLADRRSRADADCNGSFGGVASRGAGIRTLPLESFFLDYGKQDRAAGRIRAPALRAEARSGHAFSRLQDHQAHRRRYFRGARRILPEGRRRPDQRSEGGFRRNGRNSQAREGRRSEAARAPA